MARKPRIHYSGALYHVMLRGNHGEQIFFNDKDRTYFYSLLEEGSHRFNYQIHAFCLMTNHVHLVIQVNEFPLSKIMHNIAFRYARWINYKNSNTGHLFQGRYKAILVDTDNYILTLLRYVHLNPIKAALADNLNLYNWSSHHAYTGQIKISWLTTDFVLGLLSRTNSEAHKKYLNFIQVEISDDFHQQFLLSDNILKYSVMGDDIFLKKIVNFVAVKPKSFKLTELISIVCKHFLISEEMLTGILRRKACSKARVIVGALAKEFNIANISTLAVHLKRDVSYFSRLQFENYVQDQDYLIIREKLLCLASD